MGIELRKVLLCLGAFGRQFMRASCMVWHGPRSELSKHWLELYGETRPMPSQSLRLGECIAELYGKARLVLVFADGSCELYEPRTEHAAPSELERKFSETSGPVEEVFSALGEMFGGKKA